MSGLPPSGAPSGSPSGRARPVRWQRLTAGFASDPEAVILAVLCVLGGLAALFGGRPGSIQQALPGWLQACWSVALLGGGLLRTVGLLTRRIDLDGAGCWLLGPAALIFGAVLLGFGWRGLVVGLLVVGIGAGALVRCRRYWLITRELQARRGRGVL